MQDAVRYCRIVGDNYRHVWVVGDLHGCYQQLLHKLVRHNFDERCDLLIAVGDLIDRGPDSAACLALLQNSWFVSVLGNHELMAQGILQGDNGRRWRDNGGDWYFALGDIHRHSIDRLITLTLSLPHIIEVTLQQRRYVIAHADYPSDHYVYGKLVECDDVVWSRRRLQQALRGHCCRIDGADRFLFGHTPLEKVTVFSNQVYLDTGAVFGGPLTLLRLR